MPYFVLFHFFFFLLFMYETLSLILGCSLMVEHLPSTCETLGSSLGSINKQNQATKFQNKTFPIWDWIAATRAAGGFSTRAPRGTQYQAHISGAWTLHLAPSWLCWRVAQWATCHSLETNIHGRNRRWKEWLGHWQHSDRLPGSLMWRQRIRG